MSYDQYRLKIGCQYKTIFVKRDDEDFSKGYPMPFAKKSSYPNIEQIAEQFEQELIEIKQSGVYDEIREKWLE